MRTLNDEDIEAIVQRLLQVMGQRLSASVIPIAITPPAIVPPPARAEPATKEVTPKLAYTLKELSAELGVSKVTIYRLTARGLLKPLPYLRTKVFARAEVERFLAEGMDWNSTGRTVGRRPRSLPLNSGRRKECVA